MTTPVVVMAKGFSGAKSRLSPPLAPGDRSALAERMLRHVLGATEASARCGPVFVATDCPQDAALAAGDYDAQVLWDAPRTSARLGDVVDAALERLSAAGHGCALVLMADLPQLSGSDVDAMLAALANHDAAIAPDVRRAGCNALGLRLPAAATCFGHEDSFERHRRDFLRRGLDLAVVERPGLQCDVDGPQDLQALPQPGSSAGA